MTKAIPLADVIRVLNRAKVSFVLDKHSASQASELAEERGGFDLVVARRHVNKAIRVLGKAFDTLEIRNGLLGIRGIDRRTGAIVFRIIKPNRQPWQSAMRNTRPAIFNGQRVRVPSVEMSLVIKFSAHCEHGYDRDISVLNQDVRELAAMVADSPRLNKDRLGRLAARLFPEARRGILRLVGRVEGGQRVDRQMLR